VVPLGFIRPIATFPGDVYFRCRLETAQWTSTNVSDSRPEDTPAQQPTKYELVINSKTAKALRLSLSAILLAAVDDLIE
jgi:putative ABC transport system substrate-binding protein